MKVVVNWHKKFCEKEINSSYRKMDYSPYVLNLILFLIFVFGIALFITLYTKQSNYTLADSNYDKNVFYSKLYSERIRALIIQAYRHGNKTINASANFQTDKVLCDEIPKLLTNRSGYRLDVIKKINKSLSIADVERANTDLSPGGSWEPDDCIARHHVAIIVPYRNRYAHLVSFLSALIPLLKKQKIHFKIYLAEQAGDLKFNRGKLFNAGFLEALQEEDWQCFIFHDVDLLPEDARNMYTCPTQPRHMSVEVDTMDYRLYYEELVGGVLNIPTEQFRKANGFSNNYWGWGAEDDDMFIRLNHSGYRIIRHPFHVARYTMITHTHKTNEENTLRRNILVKSESRIYKDGLNTIQYKLISKTQRPLYTRLKIHLGQPTNFIMYKTKSCDGPRDIFHCILRTLLY